MNIGYSILGITLSLALVAPTALACTEDGKGGIVPENDLYIPADQKADGAVTEAQFDSIINEVATIYAPIVARAGAQLKIQKNWKDGTVNARAMPKGNLWYLLLYGGMARHPEMTADGYTLVVCHELGHHLGGAPKKSLGKSWASSEGQSDYFATLKCLRNMFLNDDNLAILRGKQYPKALLDSCKASWPTPADYHICVRSGMAGMSVAKVFQAMSRAAAAPNFATPDKTVVKSSNDGHPAYQCRLDTYLQGAICPVDETVELSKTDARSGSCHPAHGHKTGGRPFCWYKI